MRDAIARRAGTRRRVSLRIYSVVRSCRGPRKREILAFGYPSTLSVRDDSETQGSRLFLVARRRSEN